MAILVSFKPPISLTSSSSCSSSSALFVPASSCPVSRLHFKVSDSYPKSSNGVRSYIPLFASKRGAVIVKASLDIDGTAPTDGGDPAPESTEEVVPVDKLPLESKMQERLEQKMRMKLAKKIRLRRKRLVRKRRMRKKGRWPPSKMKKLKNV